MQMHICLKSNIKISTQNERQTKNWINNTIQNIIFGRFDGDLNINIWLKYIVLSAHFDERRGLCFLCNNFSNNRRPRLVPNHPQWRKYPYCLLNVHRELVVDLFKYNLFLFSARDRLLFSPSIYEGPLFELCVSI